MRMFIFIFSLLYDICRKTFKSQYWFWILTVVYKFTEILFKYALGPQWVAMTIPNPKVSILVLLNPTPKLCLAQNPLTVHCTYPPVFMLSLCISNGMNTCWRMCKFDAIVPVPVFLTSFLFLVNLAYCHYPLNVALTFPVSTYYIIQLSAWYNIKCTVCDSK